MISFSDFGFPSSKILSFGFSMLITDMKKSAGLLALGHLKLRVAK
jgi:hypothetical protein